MKKLILTIIAAIVIYSGLTAQIIPESVIKNKNITSSSTFFEIQSAMNDYFSSLNVKNGFVTVNGEKSKVPGWKIYKRWEYYWESRIDRKTGKFPTTNAVEEVIKHYGSKSNFKDNPDFSADWVNLGTNSSSGGYAGIGRVNCIAFHPSDANTFWVGTPSGGIWKTINGGANWTILNNSMSVLGVSDIIIPSDYATSNTIYIATGDRDVGSMWSLNGGQAADNNSIGVYKSIDGGSTWNATGLTYTISQRKLVFRLLIHPGNNNILFASTSDGIYKSDNGGTSWTLKTPNACIDMEFKPGDPNVVYASSSVPATTMNLSANNGETWTSYEVTPDGRRGEIAVSPNNPSVVYLLVANEGGGVEGVYKSVNSGASFTKVNANSVTQPGMLGYYTDGRGPATGQGSYDWCIAVSPADVNTIFIGGITTWKSVDGGVSWTANNAWTGSNVYNTSGAPVVHADKHALIYQSNTVLFEGNDGGIYKTVNGGTNWTDLSNGLVISQLYRIGVSQTSSNLVIAGLQDNGSKLRNNTAWSDVTGGDGMECIIDHTNSNYMYATYVKGEIYRNEDGFSTSTTTTISANIPGGQPAGAWVTPYVISPNNSATLFAGYDKVWKTVDRGDSWTSASQVLSAGDKLRSLAIAPSNPNVLYAADMSNMWKTNDGGATAWTQITLPTTVTSVTYIAVKHNDPNVVWITYGGYDGERIFESVNGGTTWTNISAGLPNIPAMCVVQYKSISDRNVLYLGTDAGVYVKDGANNWTQFSNGLPSTVVPELEIYYNSTEGDRLRAATFGRGLWETPISTTGISVVSTELPYDYSLGQNYPNPFNPVTKINFQIPSKGNVTMKVFNQLGQEVAVLVNKVMNAGYYTADFDASKLPSGVYFYRLSTGNFTQTKKMMLIK